MSRHVVDQVLGLYPGQIGRGEIESLGNAGGFSGARFWRIRHESGIFCLRRWPPGHPSRDRLAFIHRVLRHVARSGVDFVPAPLPALSGATYVEMEGRFWELTAWLPGEANYARRPSREKLRSALAALAQFHTAASDLADSHPTVSRGISERCDRLLGLLAGGGASRIEQALNRSDHSELSILGLQIVERFFQGAPRVLERIERFGRHAVDQQPCIRDVWHDHILFVESSVSGIVDFGAMRTESVAADIARLLGSLAQDNQDQWQIGIEAYESVWPLNESERSLIRAFDESTVLLSGMNWLEWIYVEGRRFDALDRVLARLTEILDRLQQLAGNTSMGKVIWRE